MRHASDAMHWRSHAFTFSLMALDLKKRRHQSVCNYWLAVDDGDCSGINLVSETTRGVLITTQALAGSHTSGDMIYIAAQRWVPLRYLMYTSQETGLV